MLDIYFLRQILGIIILTFVPGMTILNILKIDDISLPKRLLISEGLSIVFIISLSFLINFVFLYYNYKTPISTNIIILIFTMAMLFLVYMDRRISNLDDRFTYKLDLNKLEKVLLSIGVLVLSASLLGVHLINNFNSNKLIIIAYILMILLTLIVYIINKYVSDNCYIFLILLLSISILSMYSFRSSHILGIDSHEEFILYSLILDNQRWENYYNSNLDACVSISLLPAVYKIFLGLGPEYAYKLTFISLLFGSPIIVFLISKRYFSSIDSFLSAFLFMSLPYFAKTLVYLRSNLALFFMGLAIIIGFSLKIRNVYKKLFLLIISIGIILSHYTTAFIYLFVLLIGSITHYFAHRLNFIRQNENSRFFYIVNYKFLTLIFIFLFFWYSSIFNNIFDNSILFLKSSAISLKEALILESRSSSVLAAIPTTERLNSIPIIIDYFINWSIIIFISIGCFSSVYKRFKDKNFNDFLFICYSLYILLFISVLVPYVSKAYSIERQFILSMLLLAPFFVLGFKEMGKYTKGKTNYLVVVLLLMYFTCTSGLLYQVYGIPKSMVLNSDGYEYNLYYISEQDYYSTKWLIEYKSKSKNISGDYAVGPRFMSINKAKINLMSLNEHDSLNYIYLFKYNILNKKSLIGNFKTNAEEYFFRNIEYFDKIYNVKSNIIYLKN